MEKNNINDLKKEIDELQRLFEDEIENLVVNDVIERHGFDINELEREMSQMNNKLLLHYSVSSDESVDPNYVYPTDSGFDLYSTENMYVEPFGRVLVPTGIHFDIPDGYEIQIRSKSRSGKMSYLFSLSRLRLTSVISAFRQMRKRRRLKHLL